MTSQNIFSLAEGAEGAEVFAHGGAEARRNGGDVAIITSAALAFSARDFLSRQRYLRTEARRHGEMGVTSQNIFSLAEGAEGAEVFAHGGAEARRKRGDVAIITSAALAFSARDFHL